MSALSRSSSSFPTAPPRVLDGFVDTLSEVSGLDLEHPLLIRLYNPVAAMPTGLHVAFAVVTGAAMAARSDSRREGGRVRLRASRDPRRHRTGTTTWRRGRRGGARRCSAKLCLACTADVTASGSIPRLLVPSGWQCGARSSSRQCCSSSASASSSPAPPGSREVRDAVEEADSTWFVACLVAQVVALATYADVFRGGVPLAAADPGSGSA